MVYLSVYRTLYGLPVRAQDVISLVVHVQDAVGFTCLCAGCCRVNLSMYRMV